MSTAPTGAYLSSCHVCAHPSQKKLRRRPGGGRRRGEGGRWTGGYGVMLTVCTPYSPSEQMALLPDTVTA